MPNPIFIYIDLLTLLDPLFKTSLTLFFGTQIKILEIISLTRIFLFTIYYIFAHSEALTNIANNTNYSSQHYSFVCTPLNGITNNSIKQSFVYI